MISTQKRCPPFVEGTLANSCHWFTIAKKLCVASHASWVSVRTILPVFIIDKQTVTCETEGSLPLRLFCVWNRAYLLEIVSNLKLALLISDVGLDLSISVVDDGQEHVEQHKEHEEHIGDEEDRAKNSVGLLQGVEVEITQDDTEQCKASKMNGSKSIYRSHIHNNKSTCKQHSFMSEELD